MFSAYVLRHERKKITLYPQILVRLINQYPLSKSLTEGFRKFCCHFSTIWNLFESNGLNVKNPPLKYLSLQKKISKRK